MARPVILTVDDDPLVSPAITRDLARPVRRATTASSGSTSGAEALDVLARLALRGRAGRADRLRPADAADDRHRAVRRGPAVHAPDAKLLLLTAYADTDVAIAGDQRHRPGLLPAQAVGPARRAALPGGRRPARRLAAGAPRADRRPPGRRPPMVGARPRDQDVPRPQPRAVPLVRRRARRRGRSGCAASPRPSPTTCRWCWCPSGAPLRLRRPWSISPTPSGCTPRASSRCTTSASSAADRPAWRPPSTPRPRGCAPSWSSARRPAARPGRARRSRTTSASRAG